MERGRILSIGAVFFCLVLAACFLIAAQAAAQFGIVTQTETELEHFNAGLFHHTGLTRSDDGEVQLLVVGIAGDWVTDTNTTNLPPLANHTAVYSNGHIIVLGGLGLGNQVSRKVYYTTVDPFTHDLADWQTTTDLPAAQYPEGLYSHASVVVHNRVYVLGGKDSTNRFATVSFARINANGTLENTWHTTTAPLPVSLDLPQAVVLGDRIYVIGGRDDTADPLRDEVYFASPDPVTGDITGWTQTTDFVHATFAHMSAVYSNTLYVMGGRHPDPLVQYSPYTHYAMPEADGTIDSWVRATDMRYNLYGAAGLAFSGFLYTTGGSMNQSYFPSDYVGTAMLNEDHTVSAWVDTSLIEPARFFHAAVVSKDGWLYVINGSDGQYPISSINRGATAGAGTTYAPSGTFTSAPLDLGRISKLHELRWNTTMADPSLTAIGVQYRVRSYPTQPWSNWIGPFPSLSTPGTVTTTQSLQGSARYVQYQVNFATSEPSMTPILNAVQLLYIPPVYDVKIDKKAVPPSGSIVYPGRVVTYTMSYSCGVMGITATNAYILDTLPEHMVYVDGSIQGPGADDSEAPLLRWQVGTLNPGDVGQVSFEARVTDTYEEEVILANEAHIYSDDGPGRFSNVVTHTAKLPVPELVVHKAASPPAGSPVEPGSQIVYTIDYSNPTIFPAEGAVLTDTYDLHDGYEVISTDPQASGQSESVWQVGDVPAGEGGDVQVVVQVADELPNHWIISNQADLAHDRMTHVVTDVVTHMVVYEGVALVDFVVDDLWWIPEEPTAKDKIKFCATVTNQGAAAAEDYMWAELYVKPLGSEPPEGPWDHLDGYCIDTDCTKLRDRYVGYVGSLASGASKEVCFQALTTAEAKDFYFATDSYDVYIQADMYFEGDDYYPYWGRYPEDYEQNNLLHKVMDVGTPGLYLPIVTR